jgi:hypothetical protein
MLWGASSPILSYTPLERATFSGVIAIADPRVRATLRETYAACGMLLHSKIQFLQPIPSYPYKMPRNVKPPRRLGSYSLAQGPTSATYPLPSFIDNLLDSQNLPI